MKMSEFQKAYAMFVIKTRIRKEKEAKEFKSLMEYLFDKYNKWDENADLPAEISVKRTTRKARWIKSGYCVTTANKLTLELTKETFNVFEMLIQEFYEFCIKLKEYYAYQQEKAEVLEKYYEEMKELYSNLPQVMQLAVQEALKDIS